jgi:hypothetical protein
MLARPDPRSRPARTSWALLLVLLPWPILAFLTSH